MPVIPVILNRFARGEKAARFEERIRALSPDIELWITEEGTDAASLARQAVAGGHRTLVAAGGDGTVNQVVSGMRGSDARLGLLPSGTMNVFAAELGIPSDPDRAWEIILRGETREIDLPEVNGRSFVQLAGIGLDAQIVLETDYELRKNIGPLSYLLAAARIAARTPPRLRIRLPLDGEIEGCFLLVGNGRYYGGPVPVFKEARLDDGLLDVLVFKKMGHLDLIRYLQGLVFGTHTDMGDVGYFQTPALEVECEDPVPIEVDGELSGTTPARIGIGPKRLEVLV